MEECCRRAVEAGIPAVAFTEHVDFTVWSAGDAGAGLSLRGRGHIEPLDVEGYLACVERCRSKFPELRIRTGIEAGEAHLFAGSLARVLASAPFERVLGSVHAIPHGVGSGGLVYVDMLYDDDTAPGVVRRYLAEVLRLVEGSSVFEVLAHVDFPRRSWPAYTGIPFREADFEAEYRAVFRALAGSGRVLEVNTRSPLPSPDLLRWWRDEGGRAVSFGSDAHQAYRVGARFDTAVAIAEAAGFRPGRDRYDFWRR
jgi:histidinol-phosphatase (PHP family)